MSTSKKSYQGQIMLGEIENLPFTGERMIPNEVDPSLFLEHAYRYKFAKNYVKGKTVLDIASGEGYGASALRLAGAKKVIGIEIDKKTCEYSKKKYKLDLIQANAENIPLKEQSFDVITSFETIEHLHNPELFLSECRRLISPGGLIILSTPNSQFYVHSGKNPFHLHEFNEKEFILMVNKYFRNVKVFSQSLCSVAWWSSRSLAAFNPEISKIKGFRFLSYLLRKIIYPQIVASGNAQDFQNFPEKFINSNDPILSYLVNPYVVRERKISEREKAFFSVLVGEK